MKDRYVYLASASPRRRDLLREAGVRFVVVSSSYVEKDDPRYPPHYTAMRHAVGKCMKAEVPSHALVLGADTLIAFEGQIIGKPRDRKQAREFLSRFSNRTHEVITGVCIQDRAKNTQHIFYVSSLVTFHSLTSAVIEKYLDTGEYCDKAGAYGYQEYGKKLVKKVEGSTTNVIGLPMREVLRAVSFRPAGRGSRGV